MRKKLEAFIILDAEDNIVSISFTLVDAHIIARDAKDKTLRIVVGSLWYDS